ncbi:MAG TPA: HlyD family efflux transporter periplasmic adaptor subunit [bacterium]|nr:HlyD family efflux transporter periplasmic adaptor subunit [bacterium]
MMRKKSFWLILILLLGAGLFAWRWFQKKEEAPKYQIATLERGTIETSVLATGIVQPENRLELKPPIAGRVESLLVEEGQMVQLGQVLAWLSSSERAALLDAARAKGPEELARWEGLFKPTPLLAPLNGLIIVRSVVPGQVVAATDVVLVMSDHLIVNTQVDETDIGQVKLGQTVEITLDAYPGTKISGQVTRVAFESKTVNNVTIYEVRVLPAKVPDFMRSGMTANVKFMVERREDVVILPAEALHKEGKRNTVMVPSPQDPQLPLTKEIQIGLNDGKRVEVLSGLGQGDQVLIPVLPKLGQGGPAVSNPFSPFPGGRGGGGQRR